jgi:hypothetical protein
VRPSDEHFCGNYPELCGSLYSGRGYATADGGRVSRQLDLRDVALGRVLWQEPSCSRYIIRHDDTHRLELLQPHPGHKGFKAVGNQQSGEDWRKDWRRLWKLGFQLRGQGENHNFRFEDSEDNNNDSEGDNEGEDENSKEGKKNQLNFNDVRAAGHVPGSQGEKDTAPEDEVFWLQFGQRNVVRGVVNKKNRKHNQKNSAKKQWQPGKWKVVLRDPCFIVANAGHPQGAVDLLGDVVEKKKKEIKDGTQLRGEVLSVLGSQNWMSVYASDLGWSPIPVARLQYLTEEVELLQRKIERIQTWAGFETEGAPCNNPVNYLIKYRCIRAKNILQVATSVLGSLTDERANLLTQLGVGKKDPPASNSKQSSPKVMMNDKSLNFNL